MSGTPPTLPTADPAVSGDDGPDEPAEPEPPPRPWRPPALLFAVAIFLLAVVLQCGVGTVYAIALMLIGGVRGSGFDGGITAEALCVINVLSFGIVAVAGVLASRRRLWDVFPMAIPSPLLLIPMVASVVGLSMVMSEVDNLVRAVLPMPPGVAAFFAQILGGSVVASFLALVIVAPLTEELLFRGLILRTLLQRYSPLLAIGVSAFLFAVLHMNPWQFINPLAVGALFGWWCWRTRSLWPGLVGHAAMNGMAWYYSNFEAPFDIPGYTGEFGDAVTHQPLWFTGLGSGVFGVGLVATWVVFQLRSRADKNVEETTP